MAIDVMSRKLLWGRAGDRCAYPGCDQKLSADLSSEQSEILIAVGVVAGEEAHIRSPKDDGPRHKSEYPKEKLHTYENLLLLCPTHHTIIDKNNGAGFSIDSLLEMKSVHESRVAERLGAQGQKQQNLEELQTLAVALWEKKALVRKWEDFSFKLNLPVPEADEADIDALRDLAMWLLRKKWHRSFPLMADAFDNFRAVLQDLNNQIRQCLRPQYHQGRTDRWVFEWDCDKLNRWDTAEHTRLRMGDYKRMFVLSGLVIETSRAMNFIIDAVIEELDPFYRFNDGLILMHWGDGVFTDQILRLEYSQEMRASNTLYPGLDRINDRVSQMVDEAGDAFHWDVMLNLGVDTPQVE